MSSHEANPPKPSAVTPEHIAWTTEVLERLYDVPFLRRYTLTAPAAGRFVDARATQEALLQAIQQLRPPASVPVNSGHDICAHLPETAYTSPPTRARTTFTPSG